MKVYKIVGDGELTEVSGAIGDITSVEASMKRRPHKGAVPTQIAKLDPPKLLPRPVAHIDATRICTQCGNALGKRGWHICGNCVTGGEGR